MVAYTLRKTRFKKDRSALKAHIEAAPFARERATYERLQDAKVTKMLGFNVPQLVRVDDRLRVIEMTIVTRPFVLDFASAYLDKRPEFSEDIWTEWESQRREQFGDRWRTVERVRGTGDLLDGRHSEQHSIRRLERVQSGLHRKRYNLSHSSETVWSAVNQI
jgi:hypothetical protein